MSQRKHRQGQHRKLAKVVHDEHGTLRRVWPKGFFDLPHELRDKIYRILVVSDTRYIALFRQRHGQHEAETALNKLRRVSKRIRKEAEHVFYRENVFRLRWGLTPPWSKGLLWGQSPPWSQGLRQDVNRMCNVALFRIIFDRHRQPMAEVWLHVLRPTPTYSIPIWRSDAHLKDIIVRGLDMMMSGKTERTGLTVNELTQLINAVHSARVVRQEP